MSVRLIALVIFVTLSACTTAPVSELAAVEQQDERTIRVTFKRHSNVHTLEEARRGIIQKAAQVAVTSGFSHFAAMEWGSTGKDVERVMEPGQIGDGQYTPPQTLKWRVETVAARFMLLKAEEADGFRTEFPATEMFEAVRFLPPSKS